MDLPEKTSDDSIYFHMSSVVVWKPRFRKGKRVTFHEVKNKNDWKFTKGRPRGTDQAVVRIHSMIQAAKHPVNFLWGKQEIFQHSRYE